MMRDPNTNWCLQCGADERERAKPSCTNPVWHDPNLRDATLAAERDRSTVRLPYADD